MKIKQIVILMAIAFAAMGCTVTEATEENPRDTFPSAGIASSKDEESFPEENIEEKIITILQGKKDKLLEKRKEEKDQEIVSTSKDKESSKENNVKHEEKQLTAISSEPKEEPIKPSPQKGSENVVPSDPDPLPAKTNEPEPVTPKPDPQTIVDPTPEPAPTPTPEPVPQKACPGGKNEDLACSVILDNNYYRETFDSYAEAMSKGQYYMDEIMYIGDIEITSYSVQEVYRNDHSIAYYGLNLWSNGSLIQ